MKPTKEIYDVDDWVDGTICFGHRQRLLNADGRFSFEKENSEAHRDFIL